MHYYNKNISDFNNATRHLTRQQRSIYSDLLELQYDLETAIPNDLDWICRRIVAMSESERTDVEQTLNEYFDSVDDGWSNGRCESEIVVYQDKRDKAVRAGKASGEARRRNKKPNKINNKEKQTNGRSTDAEQTLNQTINKNQQTTNNKQQTINDFDSEKSFDEFWKAYPRGEGKKPAYTKFKKKCDNEIVFAEIMQGLNTQIPLCRDIKFFPHATTWLNGERWNDEIKQNGAMSAVDQFVAMGDK